MSFFRLLILTEEAQSDLLDARDWYNDRRRGLGKSSCIAVDACFARIEENPEAFVFSHEAVRRALLKSFPTPCFFVCRQKKS